VSESCLQLIRDIRRIRNTLEHIPLRNLSPPLSFILTLTTATLFLNLPRCQLDRLQLVITFAAPAFSKTLASAVSHTYSNLYTGSI